MLDVSKDIRKLVIEAAYYAGHGHIPSALSIVEILQWKKMVRYFV